MAEGNSSSSVNNTGASSSSETVDHSRIAINILCGESKELALKHIELMEHTPENYNSQALFLLATILYLEGRPFEQAAYFMYLGLLRGFYDVNRSKDQTTSGQLSTMFSEICEPILFVVSEQDVSTLERIFEKVLKTDENIPHNYDPCWINSFGLQAMTAAIHGNNFNKQDMCVPVERWEDMAKKARTFFRDISNGILEEVRKRTKDTSNNA